MTLPRALTTQQAAELLNCSPDLLWKLARNGTAPVEPIRLGRALRWPRNALLELLELDPVRDDAGPTKPGASITLLDPRKGSAHDGTAARNR